MTVVILQVLYKWVSNTYVNNKVTTKAINIYPTLPSFVFQWQILEQMCREKMLPYLWLPRHQAGYKVQSSAWTATPDLRNCPLNTRPTRPGHWGQGHTPRQQYGQGSHLNRELQLTNQVFELIKTGQCSRIFSTDNTDVVILCTCTKYIQSNV